MKTPIGQVTHYYGRIGVAVLELDAELRIGDQILILGHTTDLTQPVSSMEIEHQKVQSVGPGAEVAIKVDEPVRRGDLIYKVLEDTPDG
jgi:putative protease